MLECSNEEMLRTDSDKHQYVTWWRLFFGVRVRGPDFLADLWIRLRYYPVPVCFGAIHVAAWNFAFPSEFERWAWRASALYCSTAIIPFFLSAILN